MDPITIAIAMALAGGLGQVGGKLLEKGVVEPALEPASDKLKSWLQRPYQKTEEDRALLGAIQTAFQQIGLPEEESKARQYLLNLGFDQLQAKDNAPLRQEFARAVLLLTLPEPELIPASLLRALRWPDDRRQILANFLAAVRLQLAGHEKWRTLIEYVDRGAVRAQLQALQADQARSAAASEREAAYLRAILADRGLDPDKPDALALAEYRDYLLSAYSRISFLFIKPAGRLDRMHTEAELETVFVPLQVYDPAIEEQLRRQRGRQRPEEREAEQVQAVTINEVLTRYPVFLLKGLPGSGKSTLLRHLAICFARGLAAEHLGWAQEPLLPILVPLRNFGRFLADHRAEYTNPAPLALGKFIEDYFIEQDLRLPPDFFRQRLQEGRCLVLLDGLDEVADRGLRAAVAQMANAFIQRYAAKGNRFGLTSRPRGYDEVADYLSRPILCTVQPLTPESRNDLVTRLLAELEPNPRLCREETRHLLADIQSKDKVDELSRNPLFCTTLTLVYKYRGTTLPERRVDVYQELVDLMLGFWETHKVEREGLAAGEELARLDGTGRTFRDDRHAVEAKRRALTDLADWMQREKLAETPKTQAEARLAAFFREREGAKPGEDAVWAGNFLDVAHQRSGLFVETAPETYAFSHQNFREYLAATALIGQRDDKMAQAVLSHAADAWWEEVILLAAAHSNLSDERREFLLEQMLEQGHLLLAGRCAVDAGDRLTAPLRHRIRDELYARMTDPTLAPAERYAAGEILDALDWLPTDLNAWLRCEGCADDGRDLLAMKYPVTNAHFARFTLAGGYDTPAYWGGEESQGWQWRIREDWSEPRYWEDARFGRERRGYPVVGVSWYEAAAYAAWLTELLQRALSEQGSGGAEEQGGDPSSAPNLAAEDMALIADLLKAGATTVRLPTEAEWENIAGGKAAPDRYPWDAPDGPPTQEEAAGLARANTEEAGLQGTSPVGMYPLGASQPFGLLDLAGNVWEWTDSWYDKDEDVRVFKGGSWAWEFDRARCGSRYGDYPNYWDFINGCFG